MADLALAPVLKLGSARVRLGTCSWTDPTLVKGTEWYPKRTMTASDRLAFYASSFPVVEADSTYYHPPSKDLAERWAERTPDGFTMDVKAYALLTGHPAKRESLWEDLRDEVAEEHQGKRNLYLSHLPREAQDEVWRRFTEALSPLREAGRLGAVLFQYPDWFTPRRGNRAELAELRAHLGDLPASVELRSHRWWAEDERDRTLGLLREHGLSAVVVDAPPASGLPTVVAATAPLALVRFHGRNDETWAKRGISAAERFRYLYRRDELVAWVPKVEALAAEADEVHLLMNNCYEDYGVQGAAALADLLVEAGATELEV
ncbi:DUF72 domain-containing protein [soil metagenome]